jgi:hypothetical protein
MEHLRLLPFIQSFGGDLIDRTDFQSADGVLNGPESVEALEWFRAGRRRLCQPGRQEMIPSMAAKLPRCPLWGTGCSVLIPKP